MAPHPYALAFMVVWFGILGLFCLTGVFAFLTSGDCTSILFGGMAVFTGVFFYRCFRTEARIVKKLLSDILLKLQEDVTINNMQNNEMRPPPLPRS